MRASDISADDWETLRGRINHGWLKNQICPAIARMRSIVQGKVVDDNYSETFGAAVLSEFGEMTDEFAMLIASFEKAMSPLSLFSQEPLCNMTAAERKRLGDVLHRLWLSRYPVRQWVSDAVAALRSVKQAHIAITVHAAGDGWDAITGDEIDGLHLACVALGRAVEGFPHRVLVMEGL